jgi:hypothetical protein
MFVLSNITCITDCLKTKSYNNIKTNKAHSVILTYHASLNPWFHFLTACYTQITNYAISTMEQGLFFISVSPHRYVIPWKRTDGMTARSDCQDTAPMGQCKNYVR